MTLTLTSVSPSTDPMDVCSGVAHGTLEATLLERDPNGVFGTATITVVAEF
jgi:hypothetical protein